MHVKKSSETKCSVKTKSLFLSMQFFACSLSPTGFPREVSWVSWGDKHNVALMSSLQVFQNKAAKIILHQPLYSSASHALATLKWIPEREKAFPMKRRRFQRRCLHVYKCLNGLINHKLTLLTQQRLHNYNTRNKVNLRLPYVKRNWENKELPIML